MSTRYEMRLDEDRRTIFEPAPESPFDSCWRLLKRREHELSETREKLAAANRRAWRRLGQAFEESGGFWGVFRKRSATGRMLYRWEDQRLGINNEYSSERAARLCNYWGREPE